MRDGRVSLRERDGSQADVPLAEAVSRLQARARPGALAGHNAAGLGSSSLMAVRRSRMRLASQ